MKRRRVVLLVYLVLLLYTFAPLLCVLVSSDIAGYCGCQVDEGNSHPCILWGHDVGGLLYDLFVAGWLMLLTIPTGALALLTLTLVLVVNKLRQFA